MSSIRRYLVTVLIALITLTSFMAALQSYRHSVHRADIIFDEDLKLLAGSLLHQYDHAVDSLDGAVAVQVWRADTPLYLSTSAPKQPITAQDGFSEQNFSGQRWRTFQLHSDNQLKVIVAQPLQQRQQLADEVVLASIYPVVLSLPLQALLIWLVVSKGLKPLLKLAEQLASKKADDLTPLQMQQVPVEMVQMLSTTNQLLAKLSDAFQREKRFASDVAHELRTPLSALQVNLHNAMQNWQQQGISDPNGLMPALQQGVSRMSALIEQIMLLNRTNPEHFKAKRQQLDLAALCREVIAELYPHIEAKQQQIALHGPSELWLAADAFALRLLVLNLLGNASKYTPSAGQLEIQLQQTAKTIRLQVVDSGPGIAESEYQRVFDRFYRVGGDRHQSGTPGSGLGLAIAKEIVLLHHGQITLGPSHFATGLAITVELPL